MPKKQTKQPDNMTKMYNRGKNLFRSGVASKEIVKAATVKNPRTKICKSYFANSTLHPQMG